MADWVRRIPRCALWAGMGLGKTSSVLLALRDLHTLGDLEGPVLVIAPLRVATSTWPDEITKWVFTKDIVCVPLKGSTEARANALMRYLPNEKRVEHRLQIFTINYEMVPWLVELFGPERWPFTTVVCDESTKLKGYRTRQGTQRAKALARVSHRVKRMILLTGTPSPNGLQDLWGQQWFVDGGERLGRTFSAFETRYFRRGYDGFSIEPMPFAQAAIEKKLKDVCLALEPKDHFDLREPIENVIEIDLPPKAREHYTDLQRRMFTDLQAAEETHSIEAVNAAVLTLKCLQLANGAAYVGENNEQWVEVHDEKIKALESIIEEAAGAPVLVAYHFRSDLARLVKAFPKGRQLDKNPQTIRDWNDGKIPVLFAHPASAGHGLNLQDGGNIIAFFGVNWNMEEHAQIIERIGPTRQKQAGHERPVFIHYILAKDTVDRLVMARLKTKRAVNDILMEAMKQENR
jgi:SNF2 family DNA or RNA helicase